MNRQFSGATTSWLTRNTVLLALTSLFGDVATEMLYPILPVFLTQTLHASGSIIGLIDGIALATQNIVQGFSGWLSDRLQQRKSIALVGYFLAAIAKPMMGLAPAWPYVFAARSLDRLGSGLRSAPRDALIAASVTEENRGKAFGLEGIGDNLGAFFGPMLTIVLLMELKLDLRTIFGIAFIPGLLAFIMMLLIRESSSPAAVEAKDVVKSRIAVDPRQFPRSYWTYLLVTALFGLGNSSNAFLILQTQEAGASLRTTILIYAGYNLAAALISYPAGYLSDHWGRRNLLLLCFLVFFAVYLGFGFTHNIVLLSFLFVFHGLYQGIFRSVGKAFASDFAPARLRASAIGWYSTTVGLLQLCASLVAGQLWDHINHAAVFFYGAFFAALGSAALLILIPAKKPK